MALVLITAILISYVRISTQQISGPLPCTDTHRTCSAFLHYLVPQQQTIQQVETQFNVWAPDILIESNGLSFGQADSPNGKSIFIKVTCSCSSSKRYGCLVPSSPYDFQGLAWTNGSTKDMTWLLCGCSSNTYAYVLSHVIQSKDTVEGLSSRFGSNITAIVQLNDVKDPTYFANDVVYYVPVNSVPAVPGDPPANSPSEGQVFVSGKKVAFPLGAIIAVGAGVVLIILLIILLRCAVQTALKRDNSGEDSLFYCFCCLKTDKDFPAAKKPTLSKELMTNVERPVVFPYEEIEAATDCFKESNKIGQGAYGSVFYGFLRGQEVAVKRMKATKTKEFMAEIKVLCKVHHANLVELMGYASYEDELFLVYENATNRSLSDRLHEPLSQGYAPLSWITRVQIALDAARGLEYIHDHTKTHYVHRDIKTSNILLDGNFRAKIADFGLAKLIEQGEESGTVTRIVGTFGYLAPEYLRDGHATTKSDVYAFGVVLFELVTGREAILRNKQHVPSTPERRSLISMMFSALRNSTPTCINKLREVADPLLDNTYPSDCMYMMAVLGQECVEEDPILRPDMKQVVLMLSQILLNSIEWEGTLAGNSRVFSGIVQGR